MSDHQRFWIVGAVIGTRDALVPVADWPTARVALGQIVREALKAGQLSEPDAILVLVNLTATAEPRNTGMGGWTLDGCDAAGNQLWRFWIRMPLGLPPQTTYSAE